MPSKKIKTIYRKLLQNYAMTFPSDPLRILNMHIEAYVRHEWKAKEPAVLDLAWREDIEIPKVKELIEKGKAKREAILEASKNMKLKVSQTEVEEWLKMSANTIIPSGVVATKDRRYYLISKNEKQQ